MLKRPSPQGSSLNTTFSSFLQITRKDFIILYPPLNSSKKYGSNWWQKIINNYVHTIELNLFENLTVAACKLVIAHGQVKCLWNFKTTTSIETKSENLSFPGSLYSSLLHSRWPALETVSQRSSFFGHWWRCFSRSVRGKHSVPIRGFFQIVA